MVIGGVVSFIAGIMFLIVAFREGALWGLAVLFIPFASLIFLVMYWNQAKKAFLLSLAGSGIVMVGAFAMGAASPDSSEVLGSLEEPTSSSERYSVPTERISRPEPSRIEVEPPDEFLPTEDGTAPSKESEIDEPESTSFPRSSTARSRRSPATSSLRSSETSSRSAAGGLSMASVENYIGEKLRFTKTNGKTIEGRLIGVDDDRITIEERVGGGRWSFSLAKSSIVKIEPTRRR